MVTIVITTVTLMGCMNKSSDSNNKHVTPCMDPAATLIYIQPLNTYSEKEAEAIAQKLAQVTDDVSMPVDAKTLPPIQLVDEFKNDAGTRYRASKILDALKQ